MPTYDYQCGACGHTFEKFHAPKETVSKTCPECKKRKVERLLGVGGGIIFKGSGFYETDYRGDSYKKDATKDTAKPAEDCTGTPANCNGPCATKDD